MIFYGTNSFHIRTDKIKSVCTNCNSENTTSVNIFSQYFHVFWIPVFPFRKYSVTNCTHCQLSSDKSQYSNEIKDKINIIKKTARTPLKTFAGLLIVGLLIAATTVGAVLDNNNTQDYGQNPKPQDRYFFESNDGYYSCMKLVSQTNDSLFFNLNKQYVEKQQHLHKIDKPANYDNVELVVYSKGDTKAMIANEIIFKIKRD